MKRCGCALIVLMIMISPAGRAYAQQRAAQQSEDVQSPPAKSLKRLPAHPHAEYIISPGDVLSIRVFQQPDMSGEMRVSAQGYIRIMFVEEPIKAAGLTEWELADLIKEKLRVVLRDPQVSVQVKEGRQDFAYILGAVNEAMPVPVDSDTRLLTMIARAKGLSERAGPVAYILRGSVWAGVHTPASADEDEVRLSAVIETVDLTKMMKGAVELNKRIYAGDVVSIPEAGKVFVGGAVNKPDAFDLRGELTLTQAITLANGTKPDAKKSRVTIVRQDPDRSSLIELAVNLSEIERDPKKDVKLQVGDVVYVPSSTAKNLGLALLNSLAVQAALLPIYIIR
ncbi:MAG: polysaccharide biosynthesis/export family protein [Acidobacteriota bacterium]|nr:polysaccharide biosynthesis/export family protein [Blastocatellia bacterium]MDW8238677.1 polysaccharide biosynthesis/export family protein [Acidobacteriota bacterium]